MAEISITRENWQRRDKVNQYIYAIRERCLSVGIDAPALINAGHNIQSAAFWRRLYAYFASFVANGNFPLTYSTVKVFDYMKYFAAGHPYVGEYLAEMIDVLSLIANTKLLSVSNFATQPVDTDEMKTYVFTSSPPKLSGRVAAVGINAVGAFLGPTADAYINNSLFASGVDLNAGNFPDNPPVNYEATNDISIKIEFTGAGKFHGSISISLNVVPNFRYVIGDDYE